MRILLQPAAALLVALAMATLGPGCAKRMQVDVDPAIDFSHYQTWGWQPRGPSARRPRPSELDRQVARRIQSALLDRGLHYVEESPDLLVTAHLLITRERVTQRTTPAVQTLPSLHESGSFEIQATPTTEILHYERGRFVVVVRDARRNQEVWRGETDKRYRRTLTPHLDEVVASLLGRFPRGLDAPAPTTLPNMIAFAGDASAGLVEQPDR